MESKPKLYLFYTSFFSKKALMFLNEKEIEFDTQIISMPAEENQSPWYLAISPKGEVPALRHGQNVIPDSDVILKYIEKNNLGKKSLYPTDPSENKMHDIWMSKLVSVPIEKLTYGLAYLPHLMQNKKAMWGGRMAPMMRSHHDTRSAILRQKAAENAGTPAEAVLLAKAAHHDKELPLFRSEENYKRMLKELDEMMDAVEVELGKHTWLVGNDFTAADCILAITMDRLHFIGHDNYLFNDSRPLVKNYWDALQSRDSFVKSTYMPNMPLYMIKEGIKKKIPTILKYAVLPLTAAFAYYAYHNMM